MATLNFGSFFDGYYGQQKSELLDADNARADEIAGRQQQEAERAAQLFAQGQDAYRASATLRDLQRRALEQGLTGQMELFNVTQPDTVARAQFNARTGEVTRAAMEPIAPQLAELTAGNLLTQARTAQARGTAGLGQAQVDAAIFGAPGVQQDLVTIGTNAAAAKASQSALQRLLAQNEQALMTDPRTQEILRTTVQLGQETKLLDGLMQVGRMDQVNKLLQPYGMEARMEGAVPVTRRIGEQQWMPWTGAMSLPFYRSLAANLENAAQAHEREAAAARARAQAAAKTPAATAAPVSVLGIPGADTGQPTPLAGRAAPAPVAAAGQPARPAPAAQPGRPAPATAPIDTPGPAGITAAQAFAQAAADLARVPNASYRDIVARAKVLYDTPRQAATP